MAKHAKLSPSASHTWIPCPASIPYAEFHGLKGKETVYAANGTAMHEVSEKCLKTGQSPDEFIGQRVYGIDISPEMAQIATVYVEYVRAVKADMKMYEQRVRLKGLEKCYGTADTIYYNDEDGILGTVDLKTGAGVLVDAEMNSQQMIYGLGAYDDLSLIYDIDEVHVTIVQPPKDHIDTYKMPIAELLEFRERVMEAAARVDEAASIVQSGIPESKYPDWMFNPGEKQCKFCNAKPRCPALAQVAQDAAVLDFKKDEAKKSTSQFLAEWKEKLPLLKDFIKMIESETQARLLAGKKVDGYRLGIGRRTQEIENADALVADLKVLFPQSVYMTTPALKSAAQLASDPVIKGSKFDIGAHIKKVPHPEVVKVDSKKAPWDPSEGAKADFSQETKE